MDKNSAFGIFIYSSIGLLVIFFVSAIMYDNALELNKRNQVINLGEFKFNEETTDVWCAHPNGYKTAKMKNEYVEWKDSNNFRSYKINCNKNYTKEDMGIYYILKFKNETNCNIRLIPKVC